MSQMGSHACSNCYMCGAQGGSLYRNLEDRLFLAPGVWGLRQCPNFRCRLLWLDPKPNEEDIGKAYESYYTHSDGRDTTTGATLTRRFIRAIKAGYVARKYGYLNGKASVVRKALGLAAYLSPPKRAQVDFSLMYLASLPAGRLLEVGCGSGSMLKTMQELGWQVEGVDFDPGAVENCRRKGLKVHLGTLEGVGYPDNYFDAVTMSHLIEHVHDPLQLVCECLRILKTGGRLSLVTPNSNSLGHRLFRSTWFHLDPPRHLHIFTPASLRSLLHRAGFHRMKLLTTIRDADLVFVASRSIQRTGRYEMGATLPRIARVWGRAMQAFEWVLLRVDHDAGEELAAVVHK